MLEAIEHLAELIRCHWKTANYDDTGFAPLAAEALRESALHSSLSRADIVETLISPWRSSDNLRSHVSPGVVTLLSSVHFDIRAHFWVDEIGSPHQHGWAGAYQVIEGSSLQARFDFLEIERVRSSFRLGELRSRSIERVEPGDVVTVEPGERMIHALWHIDRPAISISVRSRLHSDRTMDYLRPGVAFDTEWDDVETEMRLRCLAFLARADEQAHQAQLQRLALHADLPTIFFALRQAVMEFGRVSGRVLAAARERHGDRFSIIESSCEDVARYRTFHHVRQQVRERESRSFLGLLYLAPDRAAIHRFLQGQCRESSLLEQVGELLGALLIRRNGTGADMPPGLTRAFGHIGSGDGLDQALAALEVESSGDELPLLAELVEEAHAEMRSSRVFSSLLA